MKFLIVGLGNPGEKYENTRHNIGFKILDFLSDEFKVDFKEERYGYITMFKFKARQYFLLKPSTYMNLSGKAVNFWLQKLSLDQKKLLVINDDISLPYGLLRIKGKGGDAGHNGLKSIEEKIGNKSYARLKFGVGKDFLKGLLASPYCSIRLRRSFLPEKETPFNSETSLSNQFAAG